jgi:hypothetical protein
LLGTFENFYFSPDIHFIGRDHAIIEGDKPSRLVLRENYLKQLSLKQGGAGLTFLTPLILNEDGSKMSKSENKGKFLSDFKKAYGENYLRHLLSIAQNLIDSGSKIVKLSSINLIKR